MLNHPSRIVVSGSLQDESDPGGFKTGENEWCFYLKRNLLMDSQYPTVGKLEKMQTIIWRWNHKLSSGCNMLLSCPILICLSGRAQRRALMCLHRILLLRCLYCSEVKTFHPVGLSPGERWWLCSNLLFFWTTSWLIRLTTLVWKGFITWTRSRVNLTMWDGLTPKPAHICHWFLQLVLVFSVI